MGEKLKSQKERWEKWTASDLWKSVTDEQIRNLPSNVDKLDALITKYNLGCKMNYNGTICDLTIWYPLSEPFFENEYRGNSPENAAANALRDMRPQLFAPKRK